MDNHASHLSAQLIDCAQKNDVSLLFLPSKSSFILQPLDVGFFHVLKHKVSELTTSLGYAGAHILPRHVFPVVFNEAISQMTPSTASSAFKSVGFFPFDPSKVKALNDEASTTASDTTAEDASDDSCPTCKRPRQNILVRLGLIPQQLSDILIAPQLTPTKRSKTQCSEARVIRPIAQTTTTITEPIDLPPVPPPVQAASTKGKGKGKGKAKFIPPPPRIPESVEQPVSPVAGPSKVGPTSAEAPVDQTDTELDPLSPEDMCCVCKLYSPIDLKNSPFIKIVNWGQCSVCGHWVHLKFCTKEVALRRNSTFLCIHCKER